MKTIKITAPTLCLLIAAVAMGAENVKSKSVPTAPHPALSAKNYRGCYPLSAAQGVKLVRTPDAQAIFEKRVDWYHKAKYGVLYHFLADMGAYRAQKFRPEWTSEKWNAFVDAVDVEKVAEQVAEMGAGYVILALGQNSKYYCAPNPVIEKRWNLKPTQYGSKRDLPMDLYEALNKRGIRMMLYTTGHGFSFNAPPQNVAHELLQGEEWDWWEEAIRWWSDHYGTKCSGWWLDGVHEWPGTTNWPQRMHAAVKHGNPDALAGSGVYEVSDFAHGHCQPDWTWQQRILPYFGRWDPDFNIQWQAYQYLGKTFSAPGVTRSTASMVAYAKKIVEGGGVITFDLGTLDKGLGGPTMVIKEDQMNQLRAVRDALKDVPATDGKDRLQTTLQNILVEADGDKIKLNAAWPPHWTSGFKLKAPQETIIEGRVEDGRLVDISVTPETRRKDLVLP